MFLYKRNKIYQLQYFDEYENRLKRISTGATTKTEALNFVSNLKRQQKEKGKIKFVLLSQFRDEYIKFKERGATRKYITSIKLSFRMLINEFNDIPILKLEKREIEQFLTKVYEHSPGAAHLYFRTLKAAFNKGKEWLYLKSNPFAEIKLPKKVTNKPLFLSEEQFYQIMAKVNDEQLKDLFIVDYYTGLRLAEITNLKWNQIDFVNDLIRIKSDESFTTKSKKERIIPMSDIVKEILSIRLPKVMNFDREEYVFNKYSMVKLNDDYVSKAFKKSVRKIPRIDGEIHFHSLRHSFASNLVQKGVSLYVVKELLGHEDLKTTSIYAHLQNKNLVDAVKLFNAIKTTSNKKINREK